MKIGQDFTEIGAIANGELVIKFPGTDLKMPYEKGKAFLSGSGVGCVSLPIRDAYCQENGEPEGLMGVLGRQLAQQLDDPSVKRALKKMLVSRDHSLFYSREQGGVEILCLPGMSGERSIDTQNIPKMVVVTYPTNGQIPSAEQVYAYHMEAVGRRTLITDRGILEKEVLNLVPKANGVYEKALQVMKNFELEEEP